MARRQAILFRVSVASTSSSLSTEATKGEKCRRCWRQAYRYIFLFPFSASWRYVDDKKLSHVNPNVVTYILEEIKKHFGELVISRGDEHDFLGMKIKLSKEKLVQ